MIQVHGYTDRLNELGRLAHGWDSYDGVRPTDAAVAAARCCVPCPLSDGGIQIDFHAGGIDVEIDIGPDGKCRGVFINRAD